MQSNSYDPFDLLALHTPRIIVAMTYRLNIFGFLAGTELADVEGQAGNYGLWDQRAAIEWVYENIELFSGNRELITVGGLSAGAHSAFLQLYYDTFLDDGKRIIKQGYFWSNALMVQPNETTSQVLTDQWKELCDVLGVKGESAKEKLEGLRAVSSEDIVSAIRKLKMHTFRTSTDGDFVSREYLKTIHDGSFAARLAKNGVRIMLGEVCDEALLYKLVNPPSTYTGLVTQVQNYYPKKVVDKLLTLTDVYDIPEKDEKGAEERFADVFSEIVADMQVHAATRGLTQNLLMPADKTTKTPEILRYRIAWRAKSLDEYVMPEVGVCHAADNPIWWLSGCRAGFDEKDRKAVLQFLEPFGQMLEGKAWKSGKTDASKIDRFLDNDGVVHESIDDPLWDKAMLVCKAIAEVQQG